MKIMISLRGYYISIALSGDTALKQSFVRNFSRISVSQDQEAEWKQ